MTIRDALGLSTFGVGCAFGPILIIAMPFVIHACMTRIPQQEFDADVWMADSTISVLSESTARLGMVNDLLDRYQLGGMTKNEIVALLGEPDDLAYEIESWSAFYTLSRDRMLVVSFDNVDVVTDAYVYID